jgi:nucleoside-diphosphate-sugar epimerase
MIAVYGANGFIGSRLCQLHDLHKMGRNEITPPKNVTKVIYLISTIDNYNVLSNPYIDIETNLVHLIRVLEACKGKNIEFTFVSSWFVYGEVELPAKESSHCDPKGFYSITKRTAEQLLESYCKTFAIDYKIVRLANVVGNTDNKVSAKKNALQYLINEMREDKEVKLYHGGDFYRDFIHVDDAAEGIKLVCEKGKNGEIYNLGSGDDGILFKDIIAHVHSVLKSKSLVGSTDPTKFHQLVQVRSMILDTTKINKLGFIPKYKTLDAINTLLQ